MISSRPRFFTFFLGREFFAQSGSIVCHYLMDKRLKGSVGIFRNTYPSVGAKQYLWSENPSGFQTPKRAFTSFSRTCRRALYFARVNPRIRFFSLALKHRIWSKLTHAPKVWIYLGNGGKSKRCLYIFFLFTPFQMVVQKFFTVSSCKRGKLFYNTLNRKVFNYRKLSGETHQRSEFSSKRDTFSHRR